MPILKFTQASSYSVSRTYIFVNTVKENGNLALKAAISNI